MSFESDATPPEVQMTAQLSTAIEEATSSLNKGETDAAVQRLKFADRLVVRAIRKGFHIVMSVDAAAYDASVSAEWDSVPAGDRSEEGYRVFRCDSSVQGKHARVIGDPPVVGTQKGRGIAVKMFPKRARIGVAKRDGGSVTSPWVLLTLDEVVSLEIVPRNSQSE